MADLILGTSLAVLAVLGLSMLIALARLKKGPSLPDRVVALDLCGLMVVAVIAVVSIKDSLPILLDVAIAIALLAFIGTVAFARYLEAGV